MNLRGKNLFALRIQLLTTSHVAGINKLYKQAAILTSYHSFDEDNKQDSQKVKRSCHL